MELDKIYNMDCLDGMAMMHPASVDAIICDLPYGTTKNKWDAVIPLPELWQHYKRLLKPNGAIVLFSQMPFTAILACSNIDWLKYEWIWEKENATGHLNSHFAPMKKHENILVFSDGAAGMVKDRKRAMKYNPQYNSGKPYTIRGGQNNTSKNYGKQRGYVLNNNDGNHYYPTDILQFKRDANKMHPTQKPVDLIRYLVRTYTNEGDIVLDNCMGSGTTAIACIKEKRHFIGFEINKEYFDRAQRRINAERQQLTLF